MSDEKKRELWRYPTALLLGELERRKELQAVVALLQRRGYAVVPDAGDLPFEPVLPRGRRWPQEET